MANFNQAVVMGNLTRDPEVRFTPGGTPVCNFDLAINRSYTSGGEKKSDVTYLPILVFGPQAETCGKFLSKGRGAHVVGRIQNRSWETPEGAKRSKTEIVADSVQFLGNGKPAGAPAEPEAAAAPENDEVPF